METTRNLIRLSRVFFSFARKDPSPAYQPLKLWIETTTRCNLSCSSCLNRKLPASRKKDMDLGLYKYIIDQAAGKVRDINLFHRGEPLLHPDIAQMVSYASKKGLKTSIHTNAALLSKELGEALIMAGLDFISFSIDTLDPDSYRRRRKGAELDKTLENIRGFLEAKKRLEGTIPKATKAAFQLMADGVEGKHDLRQYRRSLHEMFRDYSPYRIIYRRAHNWGGLLDMGSSGPEILKKTGACTFPWYSLTIFPDGKVYPCPQDFMGSMPVGDLEKETLQEVFAGEPLKKLRKMFASGKIDKKLPCSGCDRISRKTFMGIPVEYAFTFFRDNIANPD
jgi:radical SAM protein with 4Fe4S-binding SPASM domain